MNNDPTNVPLVTAERYHDISMGHRVVGHESKCRRLHGHNYRIHFVCAAPQTDSLGRVIDFGILKERLCLWLEEHWDHRLLLWDQDPLLPALQQIVPQDIVTVPFNPTAEAIARYLTESVAPVQLQGTGAELIACRVEETAKCAATYRLPRYPL